MLADTSAAAGTQYYVMATGTYSRTTTGTFSHANGTPAANIVITGANSSGVVDGTEAVIQAGAGSITLLSLTASQQRADYLRFDGNSQSSVTGLKITTAYSRARYCRAIGMTAKGFDGSGGGSSSAFIGCIAWGCSGTYSFDLSATCAALYCAALSGTCTGFNAAYVAPRIGCIAANNSGAAKGFNTSSVGGNFFQNVAYSNGGAGFDLSGSTGYGTYCANLLSYLNGGEGYATDGVKDGVFLLNCAGGSNTSGNYNATNLTHVDNFVSLSANPFDTSAIAALTSTSSLADIFAAFRPNSAVGGGAALRGAGYPAYADIGAVQHQDSGGGGGGANLLGKGTLVI